MTMKLRVPVPFPASVTGTGGIKVVKASGIWTISPDFAALSLIAATAVSDPSLKEIWLYDPNQDQYNVLTLGGLGDALYKLTSTTSLAISVASKVFTTQANKDIGVGSWVLATSDADSTNYMSGQVTAYSGTSLTVNMTTVGGSGTHTDWTLRASGATGATGAQGPTGAVGVSGTPTVNQFTTWLNATTAQGVSITGLVKGNGASAPAAAMSGTDYMAPNTTSALTAGFTSASVSAGTKTTGTYTFDPTAGGVQHATNGGAHTFAPPVTMGSWMLDYVNNASAGAITTSGWTKVDGDAFDTTNTHSFRCMLSVGNQGSYLSVKRMV